MLIVSLSGLDILFNAIYIIGIVFSYAVFLPIIAGGLLMRLGLENKTVLEPILTQRQIQFLRLLPLSSMELEVELKKEMEENVFLDVDEKDDRSKKEPEGTLSVARATSGEDADAEPRESGILVENHNGLDFTDSFRKSRKTPTHATGDRPKAFDIEARVPSPANWRQHLIEAVKMESISGEIASMIEYLVGSLDEQGYLHESLEEVQSAIDVAMETVEQALEILQNAAPPGIGARNLQERLVLRCRALSEGNEVLEQILTTTFNDPTFRTFRKVF